MARSDKNWTAGTLKSRGWNEKLMAQLPPRPRYFHFDGKRVRTWRREDVQAAEQDPAFQTCKAQAQARRQQDQATRYARTEDALRTAAELLRGAVKGQARLRGIELRERKGGQGQRERQCAQRQPE